MADSKTEQRSPLGLSDEEIMNMPEPSPAFDEPEEEPSEEQTETDENLDTDEVSQEEEQDTEQDDETESEDDLDDEDDSEEGGEPNEDESEESEESEESDDDEKSEEDDKSDKDESDEDSDNSKDEISQDEAKQLKSELNKLYTPFKANGREIKIESVDEAIQLMQMGANYTKKMQGLQPSMRILKMLENNEVLDEGKLSYMLDLYKGNPEAVTKLLKEKKIDPLDMDLEKGEEYKPGTYTVDDREVKLDEVLNEIKSTPTYNKTIDVIGNKWDDSSKKLLFEQPEVIKVINSHMENGVFDKITDRMEKDRILGRLSGMSDIEAYKYIGDQMYSPNGQQQPAAPAEPTKKVEPKKKASDDSNLRKRRKAASPAKSSKPSSQKKPDFDPLAMSDEEFEKLEKNSKFL